jgi:hypothetical protein
VFDKEMHDHTALSSKGRGHTLRLMPVTEHPMIRPCRRTPRYHFGPIRVIFTSSKPAAANHCMYSSSVGKSIQASAKKDEIGNVG